MKYTVWMLRKTTCTLISSVCLTLLLVMCGCGRKSSKQERPLSLGQFKEISSISISHDGTQLLFDGCGHKDYAGCTIYRLDRSNNALYRYIPKHVNEEVLFGRFSPVSSRFVFIVIPHDDKGQRTYESAQIGVMSSDGTKLKRLTLNPGLKTKPTLSYDENKVAFLKSTISSAGSPLREQKTRPLRYDLYVYDFKTGMEKRLTQYEFYQMSPPYFTRDNKNILYAGDSPMRLPDGGDAKQYRDTYSAKYHENIIFMTPVDSSALNKDLTPVFTYSHGSKMPVLLSDGSLLFEGRDGIQGFIHYYKRDPDGKLQEINSAALGREEVDGALVVLYEMTATPDGRYIALLNHNQNTRERFIRIQDTKNNQLINIVLPERCTNISLPQETTK